MAKYKNIIMEDPTLDQASFDDLRTHFSAWLASQTEFNLDLWKHTGYPRCDMFLVIDEDALRSITSAPPADMKLSNPCYKKAFVKAVALDPEPFLSGPTGRDPESNVGRESFAGWMKVRIDRLFDLWQKCTLFDMSELYSSDTIEASVPFNGCVR